MIRKIWVICRCLWMILSPLSAGSPPFFLKLLHFWGVFFFTLGGQPMAVELANAYVTLAVETSNISRQVGRMFRGVEGQAEIGRASCRGRVERTEGDRRWRKVKWQAG